MRPTPPLPAWLSSLVGALALASITPASYADQAASSAEPKRLLLVSVTTGYRHASIPVAVGVLEQLAAASQGTFVVAGHAAQPDLPAPRREDPPEVRARFEAAARVALAPLAPERLRAERIDAVVFVSTTGELPLPDTDGLLSWIEAGGAFVGLHSATDTLSGHPGYCCMISGVFDGHPWHEPVTIRVETPDHPAAGDYRAPFELRDEIYQFKHWSRGGLDVILSLDPSNAERPPAPGKPAFFARGKRADQDYALAWTRRSGAGRVAYTALGHDDAVWLDPRFQAHVLGCVRWALGLADETSAGATRQ